MELSALWVRTNWTKKSRGGKAAARRNAVPTAFALPDNGIFEVTMHEHTDFAPVWQSAAELKRDEVDLTEEDTGRLRVQLSEYVHGLPQRNRHPAVRIEKGQWIRWQINYRMVLHCRTGEWRYRQDTLNLAYGNADPTVFLTTAPVRHVDERVHLF
ncbi:hypothetical protein ALI144C_50720 [Actinosynnema sp. ALI-1.44]|uniref:hypothetical protein n=1 Tax=Actinosynnema sp. ALI-1.44 TaxID=1933779 RepID=UPI00097CA049|nr:hypothetical protein [Actinosynnema sp. ALI-1.44]ONI70871.1 hypothetical protein ALI144C_50720 [Actinosynnema sp. ALI-1.44]